MSECERERERRLYMTQAMYNACVKCSSRWTRTILWVCSTCGLCNAYVLYVRLSGAANTQYTLWLFFFLSCRSPCLLVCALNTHVCFGYAQVHFNRDVYVCNKQHITRDGELRPFEWKLSFYLFLSQKKNSYRSIACYQILHFRHTKRMHDRT